MKTLPVLALLSFCLPVLVSAQGSDSSATIQFPEIVVTATRSTIPLDDSPSPVEVIRAFSYDFASMGEMLRRSSGLSFQDLGGGGALQTASVRGTATQHLLILLNGYRLNSFQNGLVDLSLLPLSDIDRVEVVRGGSSALYGADALGGVVNILTRSAKPGFHMRVEGSAGSFGFRHGLLESSIRTGIGGILVGFMKEAGNGDYSFLYPMPGGLDSAAIRQNADFRKEQAYVSGDLAPDPSSTVSFIGRVIRAETGVPGSLTFPSPEARQKDDEASLQTLYQTSRFENLEIQIGGGFQYSLQDYRDPNPFFPLMTRYRNSSFSINPQVSYLLSEGFRMSIGGEFGRAYLRGDDFVSLIARRHNAFYVMSEFRVVTDRRWFDRFSVYGTMRYDDISDVGTVFMPKIGFNVRILREGNVRLRASYGRSFRAPSFNDLYYAGFSNPDLRPEYSRCADAGILCMVEGFGTHTAELTYFSLKTTDRIIFDLMSFKPDNIGATSSSGVEARYAGSLFLDLVDLKVNYTLTEARKLNKDSDNDPTFRKRLVFIPQHISNLEVTFHAGPLNVSLFHAFVGRRFTSEDNTTSIAPYHVTAASVVYPFSISSTTVVASLRVENLFDKSYESVEHYPMPGRNIKAGIRMEY